MAEIKVIKREYLPFEKWYKHFKFCKKERAIVLEKRTSKHRSRLIANLEINAINVSLTYRKDGKTICYCSRMDGADISQHITGMRAYTTMCQNILPWHIPNLRNIPLFEYHKDNRGNIHWAIEPTKQLMYFNPKLNNNRYEDCYGYDLNSAFTTAMMQPIPDTEQEPDLYRSIKKGEIGFLLDGTVVFEPHTFANFIFKEKESPFIKFAEKWYAKKRDAKTKEDKEIAKQTLNFCIGYMHRTNPFIRNCIVQRSNNLILGLTDDDTLYCNTDSIVSRKRRLDLEKNLGKNLGQWKIEHRGEFAYKDFSYQWNDAIPTYRGISKQWFLNFEKANGRFWDLLVDPIPTAKYNGWIWNEEKFDFDKVEWGEADEEIKS